MNSNNSSAAGFVGAILGISLVLGFVVMGNKDLKREVESQLTSVLKSTKKIVNHYRRLSNNIAAGDKFGKAEASRSYNEAWDNIPTRSPEEDVQ